VRTATENVLADFLRELRDVTAVNRINEEQAKDVSVPNTARRSDTAQEKAPEQEVLERSAFIAQIDEKSNLDNESAIKDEYSPMTDVAERDTGGELHIYSFTVFNVQIAWVPGQGVRIYYAAIIEILIQQLDSDRQLKPII
jgi:vacuole morphology and inheritance protein 14